MVQLMNRTGGSAAFGAWASNRIKSRAGAQLSTMLLGCLIFIDDYFNCLTVGSVMRPVTDKHKISRAKLAYLIDSTAAPSCLMRLQQPLCRSSLSSWQASQRVRCYPSYSAWSPCFCYCCSSDTGEVNKMVSHTGSPLFLASMIFCFSS